MRAGLIAAIVTLSVGIASPGAAQSSGQLLKGGAVGAGAGAIAGAIIPGVSVGTGALIGGASGLAFTAIKKRNHYYRDDRSHRYYIDKRSHRAYK
jgi:hypothetical protein